VVIANKGPSTANHPKFTNAVPANTTFLSADVSDPIGEFHCTTPAVGTTGNIVCTAPAFDLRASGDQPVFTFTFRVNNGVTPETTLTNTASVSGDEGDPNTSNNTVSRTTAITTSSPSADVSVTTGGGATFSVVVRNAGPNDATSVTLTNNVPSASTFASWTQISGPTFTCNTPSPGATGTISCTIGILPGFDGKTTAAEFALALNTSGQVTNSVSVSSTTTDPLPGNNVSSFPSASKVSIDDVTVTEGNSGTSPAVFTVRLQPASAVLAATVDYQVVGVTAFSGSDFLPNAGTLTFQAGETQKTITVAIVGDVIAEEIETYSVLLSNAVNATLDDPTGIGTIVDNDSGGPSVPSVQIGNVAVPEGNGTSNITFTATLSATSTTVSRVRWQTQDGTATAGADYTASSGELVFQPGDLTKTFTVPILGDSIFEPDETFTIVIVGTENNSTFPGPAATGTLINDDAKPPSRRRAVGH
jgi:uncharacterized repeat protein (TIGR01451 family)